MGYLRISTDNGDTWVKVTPSPNPVIVCEKSQPFGSETFQYKGFKNGRHVFESGSRVIFSEVLPEGMSPNIGDKFESRDILH